jgi:hypothetical protein
MNSTARLTGISWAQIEKQLNLILSPFQTSVGNMKSYAQHIQSKCIARKQTFMSMTSIHRENNTNQEFESKLLSINSNACTWVFFIQYSLLALLF